jgi:hypothetical protein
MVIHGAERDRREAKYQADRALALYGEKSDLAEVKQRVALHPTFANLPERGQALVAQVASVMGINPFMHLHAWIDSRKQLNITLDYKGLMFLAGGESDVIVDSEKSRALTKEEMLARGINPVDIENGAIAAVCYITQISKLERLAAIGQADKYKPTAGYAVWYPKQEKTKRDGTTYMITNEPPNGRDGAWVAQKNALRDALNKIADLSLKMPEIEGARESGDGWVIELEEDPAVIDGVFTEKEEDENADETPDFCVTCRKGLADPGSPFPTLCKGCAEDKANRTAEKD